MPVLSGPESEKEVYRDNSSETSSWDSDVSIGDIFRSLSVNMVSTSHVGDDEEDTFESEELIQSDTDPRLTLKYSLGYALRIMRTTH